MQLIVLCMPAIAQKSTSLSDSRSAIIKFTFDEQSGNVAHNSGSAGPQFDASVGGGTIKWRPGLFKGAAELSNNGYFKLPAGPLEKLSDFSLSVWVYIKEQTPNQTVCTFAKGTDQYLILTTQRGDRENGVSLVITKNKSGEGLAQKEERISYTGQKEKLTANAWHHLAFTLKGNTGTLFVDGVKAAVKEDFSTSPARMGYTTDNYIGRPTWPDPYLNGMIDELAIYDYSLSDEQVYRLSAAADQQLVLSDRETLSVGDLSALSEDLHLPAVGKSGTRITWLSDHPEIIDIDGSLRRPDAGRGDVRVRLTAKIEKGTAAVTKTFQAVVKDISWPPQDLNVFSLQTGNPVIPAYLADASFFYDDRSKIFYAYGTNDGAGGGNVYPTQVWYSRNCRDWKNKVVDLPKEWTDQAGTKAVWAPSIAYNAVTKKYYLMYGIDCKTFIGMSDHPLGPWEDANGASPGKMFYAGYDGQFFVDDNNEMYISTDNGKFKIIKLKFDRSGKIFFDNEDPRFTKTSHQEGAESFRYAQIDEIKNSFEASYIYKRNNLYYLMWSFEGSENYNVRYAVSENITGPYREINQSMTVPILKRDDSNHILGPGHHSMFNYDQHTFIAYHRQHYPFVDSKRQTCIDEVFFNPDGSIKPILPTHKGVTVVKTENQAAAKNLALGKQTLVSSARDYDNSTNSRRYRTHDISFRYSGNFAVDENYGTHWDAGTDSREPWLIVDLDRDCEVDSVETIFEFTSRTYRYRLEYLTNRDASDLNEAALSNKWATFADRGKEGVSSSPVIDFAPKSKLLQARYLKLTIAGAIDLPPTADDADPENARNALSVFELKVFGSGQGDDLNRHIDAMAFRNQYGVHPEKDNGGVDDNKTLDVAGWDNNDYLLFENINFGKGASRFQAEVAGGEKGGWLEIHLDSLNSAPATRLNLSNSTNEWKTVMSKFNIVPESVHKKVYLQYKSPGKLARNFKLKWVKFIN